MPLCRGEMDREWENNDDHVLLFGLLFELDKFVTFCAVISRNA